MNNASHCSGLCETTALIRSREYSQNMVPTSTLGWLSFTDIMTFRPDMRWYTRLMDRTRTYVGWNGGELAKSFPAPTSLSATVFFRTSLHPNELPCRQQASLPSLRHSFETTDYQHWLRLLISLLKGNGGLKIRPTMAQYPRAYPEKSTLGPQTTSSLSGISDTTRSQSR